MAVDLADRADITPTVEGSTPGWSVTRYDRTEFNPAVHLVCSDDDLAAYLAAAAEDAADVFPEVPALVGAYRLLLVHLEEALLSMTPPTAITVTASGVQQLTGTSPNKPPTRSQKRLAAGGRGSPTLLAIASTPTGSSDAPGLSRRALMPQLTADALAQLSATMPVPPTTGLR